MVGITFIAGLFTLLLGCAAGAVVGWIKGPLAGMSACLGVLLTGFLGYAGLVLLTTGM